MSGSGKLVRCNGRRVPADAAEAAALDAISEAVLPATVIEAAREQLRRRLAAPRDRLVDRQRTRLQTRLEQLRKQHEWADVSDAEYRAKRAETQRELAALPDSDKLLAFDRNRHVLTSMAANVEAATPPSTGRDGGPAGGARRGAGSGRRSRRHHLDAARPPVLCNPWF